MPKGCTEAQLAVLLAHFVVTGLSAQPEYVRESVLYLSQSLCISSADSPVTQCANNTASCCKDSILRNRYTKQAHIIKRTQCSWPSHQSNKTFDHPQDAYISHLVAACDES